MALGRGRHPRAGLRRQVVGTVVRGLLHPHDAGVGRVRATRHRGSTSMGGHGPARCPRHRTVDAGDRHRRVPVVVDGLAPDRRRLVTGLGGRPSGLPRPRGASFAVALPRGSLAIPHRTQLGPPLQQQRTLVAVPGAAHVVLLREHQGRLARLPHRQLLDGRHRARQSVHLVVRHRGDHPSGVAVARPTRLAFRRGPRRHCRRVGAVAALPRPHDLHLLHRGVRALSSSWPWP